MIFTRGLRVCLAAQPADLRRSFEGLALLVRGALKEDERSSQIFVFTTMEGPDPAAVLGRDWSLAHDEKARGGEFFVAEGAGGGGEDRAAGGSAGDVVEWD